MSLSRASFNLLRTMAGGIAMTMIVAPALAQVTDRRAESPPARPPKVESDEATPIITAQNAVRLSRIGKVKKNDAWKLVRTPTADTIGVLGWERPLEIRDGITLRLLKEIGEGKRIVHFDFSPKGGVAAYSENSPNSARILDTRAGITIALDEASSQPRVAFSPDGSTLATGGSGTEVQLWRASDGGHVCTFEVGPVEGGLTPAFSPDGRFLAVGHRNATTTVFDLKTMEFLADLPKPMSQDLRFDPGSRSLAVAYVDGSLALWHPDGRLIRQAPSDAQELYAVDWSPDGKLLATSGRRGTITIWDARDLTAVRQIPSSDWVIDVMFSPDGRRFYAAGGDDYGRSGRWVEVYTIK